jgi:hypothetical protein
MEVTPAAETVSKKEKDNKGRRYGRQAFYGVHIMRRH